MPEYNLIQKIILYAPPALLAITLHEACHGYAAKYFGDTTAEMLGRLTLNPIKHIDPIGTIAVPVLLLVLGSPALFGWAKPVPISTRNLGNPRWDMVWVAAAGPAANIAMALGWGVVLKLASLGLFGAAGTALGNMAWVGLLFNVLLAVFNMVPVPPLDGGRVLSGLLSPRLSMQLDRLEPYGMFIIVGLLVSGVLWPIILPVVAGLQGWIFALLGL